MGLRGDDLHRLRQLDSSAPSGSGRTPPCEIGTEKGSSTAARVDDSNSADLALSSWPDFRDSTTTTHTSFGGRSSPGSSKNIPGILRNSSGAGDRPGRTGLHRAFRPATASRARCVTSRPAGIGESRHVAPDRFSTSRPERKPSTAKDPPQNLRGFEPHSENSRNPSRGTDLEGDPRCSGLAKRLTVVPFSSGSA